MRLIFILIVSALYLLPTSVWARCVQGNCLNGQGTVMMPDGRKYVGEFKDGVRVGQGLMTFPDGTKYIGNWQHDKPHGRGKLSSAGKYDYVGEFKNGVRHGQGTLETVDGKKYEGRWENDVPHGQGKIIYPGGAQYAGQFKNGKRHGEGEALYADGSKYVGQWQDDTRNGRGTMTYVNGDQYTGDFMSGQRHGMGILVMPDGSRYSGQWQDDVNIKKEQVISPAEIAPVEKTVPDVEETVKEEPAAVKQPVIIETVEIETVEPGPADAEQPVVRGSVAERETVSTGETVTAAKGNFASVLNNGVYVRSGPSSEYRIIRSVNRGYPVEIVERQGDWAHIQDYLESEGWVHGSLLGANNSVMVTTTKANLRSGPGTNNPIVDKIDYGTVLWVKDISNDWYRVETRDSRAGWLHQEFPVRLQSKLRPAHWQCCSAQYRPWPEECLPPRPLFFQSNHHRRL